MSPRYLFLLVGLAAAGCGKSEGPAAQPADGGAADVAPKDAPIEAVADAVSEPLQDAPVEAGDAGISAKPVWTDIGEAVGCKVQRLANAPDVRVFTWIPCDGIPGCERAKYDPNVVPKTGYVSGLNDVGSPGDSVVASQVVFDYGLTRAMAFFVDEAGKAVDGYRTDPSGPDTCGFKAGSVSSSRYGALVCNDVDTYQRHCGGVVREPGGAPTLFSTPEPQKGIVAELGLGNSLWLWNWTPSSFLSSVSAYDGGGFTVLQKTAGVKEFMDIAVAGSSFLVGESIKLDGGIASASIAITDGVSPPVPYLVPPANEYYLLSGYAHSHVAWLRAVNPEQNYGPFERIELWASPFSTDPAALKPEKVADLALKLIPIGLQVAGHGYYAVSDTLADKTTYVEAVWNLSTKTRTDYLWPQDVEPAGGALGITKTHVWATPKFIKTSGIQLVRFALP